jgi:hypothetical protein
MLLNFVSYKLCKLFVCLMCVQMFFVCISHFSQFTLFLLGPFKSVKEGFCFSIFHNNIVTATLLVKWAVWNITYPTDYFPANILFVRRCFWEL